MCLLILLPCMAMGVWCFALWYCLFYKPREEYKAWLIQHYKERKDEADRLSR